MSLFSLFTASNTAPSAANTVTTPAANGMLPGGQAQSSAPAATTTSSTNWAGLASAGAGALGQAIKAYSGYAQGQQQSQLAEMQQRAASVQYYRERDRIRGENSAAAGRQRAFNAANGIDGIQAAFLEASTAGQGAASVTRLGQDYALARAGLEGRQQQGRINSTLALGGGLAGIGGTFLSNSLGELSVEDEELNNPNGKKASNP